jgi:hypothetical protein
VVDRTFLNFIKRFDRERAKPEISISPGACMIMSRKAVILGLALAGCCLPTTARTAEANVLPPPQIADVALYDGGLLVGQIVNAQNAPQGGVAVALQDMQNRQVAAAVTDKGGKFAIRGVPGGVYQLVTPQGRHVYRVWAPRMAPPSAQQGILLVVPDRTVRGQLGNGSFLNQPAVVGTAIGAGVATAVAVPVAYSAGINKRPSSP